MAQMKKILMLLISSLVIFGCQKKNPSSSPSPTSSSHNDYGQYYDYPYPSTSSNSAHSYDKASIYCSNEQNCNASIGALLYMASTDKTGICTAFLIDADIVATSSHCVPTDIFQKMGTSQIKVIFPRTSTFPGEHIYVTEIKFNSEVSKENKLNSYDYAFLKLAHSTTRPSIRISKEGLPDKTTWTITSAQIDSNSSNGLLIKQESKFCETTYASVVDPLYNDPSYPFAYFKNCDVVGGNSGSPVLDENGHARAILSNGKSREAGPFIKNFGIAHNFNCIVFSENERLPKICSLENHEDEIRKLRTRDAFVSLKKTLEGKIKELEARYPYFQWMPFFMPQNKLLGFIPICYNEPDIWINQFKGNRLFLPKQQDFAFLLDSYQLDFSINESQKIDFQLNPYNFISHAFSLNLRQVRKNKPVPLNLSTSAELPPELQRFTLVPCKTLPNLMDEFYKGIEEQASN